MKTFECGHCGGLNDTAGLVEDIRAFHIKFNRIYDGPPRPLPPEELKFRWKTAIPEEIKEYLDAVALYESAMKAKDFPRAEEALAKMLDATIDLIYFALGSAYLQGFGQGTNHHDQTDPNPTRFLLGWRAVHLANMAKELSSAQLPSKRGAEFNGIDIVKPPGWVAPDLRHLVREVLTMGRE